MVSIPVRDKVVLKSLKNIPGCFVSIPVRDKVDNQWVTFALWLSVSIPVRDKVEIKSLVDKIPVDCINPCTG